jgi:aryl-alcohol dehydrogenase-like predicted oxidoreductase
MDTAPLGPLTVSRLCIGTMLMGSKTPVEESHRMLDRYLEAGGNFLDTADVYDDGGSEETLAPWLAAIATRSCSRPRCASRSRTRRAGP